MFAVLFHNAAFDNPSECVMYGPYADLGAAKLALSKVVLAQGDGLLKVDEDGDYAGYDYEDLINAGRDEDLASEVWVEVVPLTELEG